MSDDLSEELPRLLTSVRGLEDDESKLGYLETLVRVADATNNDKVAFDARAEVVHTALRCGAAEKALVAFAWCRARWNRDPTLLDEELFLWYYKSVIRAVRHFPQIELAQFDELLKELEAYYLCAGFGLRPVYKLQWRMALDCGNLAAARAPFERWQQADRGKNSDCAACDCLAAIYYHAERGDDERAVFTAEPLLAGRPLSKLCDSASEGVRGALLLPLLRLGRLAEAAECQVQGFCPSSRQGNQCRRFCRTPAFPRPDIRPRTCRHLR